MPQQPLDFNPSTGDDTTGAMRKLDNNVKDHEPRIVAAQAKADAALPKSSPSATGPLTVNGASPMETTVGATRVAIDLAVSNGDDDRMQLLATRNAAGSGWTGVIWRLRRIVNGFQQGIIEFGQPASNTSVTIDGGKPWTTANTTVDGNNFIKRI